MTVIAYKAGVMACDSCWSDGGLIVNLANKIIPLSSGGLLGEAGDCDTRAMIDLFDRVKKPNQMPSRKAIMEVGIDYHGLLVLADGTIWDVCCDLEKKDAGLWRCRRPFYAVGCGKQLAIGAMQAGASAAEAALVACQWENQCRPPIHSVRLPSRIARRSRTK